MTFGDLSIRTKVLIALVASTLFGLLLVSALYISAELNQLRQQKEDVTKVVARIVADRSDAAVLFSDLGVLQESLRALFFDPSIRAACVYDTRNGEILQKVLSTRADACPAEMPGPMVQTFTDQGLELTEPINHEGQEIGRLFLRADTASIDQQFRDFLYSTAAGLSAVVILVLLISFYFERYITAPILALRHAALRIAANPADTERLSPRSEDEIGNLMTSFNQMIDAIQSRDRALQENNENLERQVQARTRELINANKELEAFSYSVSHDLRAPLRSIDGFSLALVEDCAERLSPADMGHLNRIRAAAQRMSSLIDSMLNLSRVSRARLEKCAVDIGELARAAFADLAEQIGDRHIEFRCSESLPAYGDPELLRIVLDNLLGNAVKYSSKVEHAIVEVDSMQENGQTVFFVRDNGAGFDKQYADRLFGAFQRMHTDSEFEGTGVGLATVYRIISRHGGEIWAEAEPNRGATFFFRLPPAGDAASATVR